MIRKRQLGNTSPCLMESEQQLHLNLSNSIVIFLSYKNNQVTQNQMHPQAGQRLSTIQITKKLYKVCWKQLILHFLDFKFCAPERLQICQTKHYCGKTCVSTLSISPIVAVAVHTIVAVDGANLIHTHKVQQSQPSIIHVTHIYIQHKSFQPGHGHGHGLSFT